jgi:hypothetical protein
MNGKPITLAAMEHENDVAMLGLMNRLRQYAKDFARAEPDIAEDMAIAAALVNHMLKARDDYK